MSTTLRTLAQMVAEEYSGLGRVGTVDSGGVTSIVDAGVASYAYDIQKGSPVYICYDAGAAAGAPETESAWVTDFARATGTITTSPAFTVAPAAGDGYEAWEKEVEHRDRVKQALNRALTTKCWYWRLSPLGILADGDCQAITGWTVNGSATRAVAALAYPYRFGRYYLAVTSSNGTDYVYQDISVTENTTWEIAVLLRTAAATVGSVQVYDLANAAAITPSGDTLSVTGETASGSDWQFLRGSFTIPTDCDRISIRLKNGTAAGVTHFGFVLVWPTAATALPLPDRLTSENMVGRAYRTEGYLDVDFPESWHKIEDEHAWVERLGRGGLSLCFGRDIGSGGPPMYEEMTFYEDLTTELSTTDCDADWAAAQGALELVSRVARRQEMLHGATAAERWRNLEMRCYADANEKAALYVTRRPMRLIVGRR